MGSNPDLQHFALPNDVSLAYRALPAVPDPSLPAIVMLHPFLTDSSFFNRQFNDPQLGGQAGKKWNMIAVDLHGHGETVGRKAFTFKESAEDTAALLDHLNISSVFCLGTSQGALVSLILGLMCPHKVKGAVLCGTSIVEMEGAVENIKRLTTNFPNVPEALQANLMMCWGPEYAGQTANPTGPKGTKETDWVSVWKERYGGSPAKEERFQSTIGPLMAGPGAGPEQLASIKFPIIMLTGTNDQLLSYDTCAVPSKNILQSAGIKVDLKKVEGGFHFLSWGKWQEVDQNLVALAE